MLTRSAVEQAIVGGTLAWDGELRGDGLLLTLGGPLLPVDGRGREIDPRIATDIAGLYGPKVTAWTSYSLEPHALVLAQARERLALPSTLVGHIAGLSHVARLGLTVHLSSPWIGRRFAQRLGGGHLVLEISNHSNARILLTRGLPAAVVRLFATDDDPAGGDRGVYGALGDIESRYAEEFGNIGH